MNGRPVPPPRRSVRRSRVRPIQQSDDVPGHLFFPSSRFGERVSELDKAGAYLGKVTDPDNPAAPPVLRRQGPGTFARELAALKVGDEVTVLAGVQGGVFALNLMDVRIVTGPPAALQMPGGKK